MAVPRTHRTGRPFSPDGKRFLVREVVPPAPPLSHCNIVLNCFQELERLVADGS